MHIQSAREKEEKNGKCEFSTADMEAYLRMCHIPSKDHVTRVQLKIHSITHWSFFIKSNEAELLKLGFPLGTSQLLCDYPRNASKARHQEGLNPLRHVVLLGLSISVQMLFFFLTSCNCNNYGLIACRVIIQYHIHSILLPLYLYLL
jgi:hypothetical protein